MKTAIKNMLLQPERVQNLPLEQASQVLVSLLVLTLVVVVGEAVSAAVSFHDPIQKRRRE